jgi:hypothetical protein
MIAALLMCWFVSVALVVPLAISALADILDAYEEGL